ncbi:hypothetical protein CYV26_12455 [Carnobacterium maltaromaticum]|uniref:hypothetical protein n=1 Tax=Carnobacterium maltaromaticum TaxID=2751 RepID=UPI000C790353|nr:hypothetical protein [Carnobacterium maltaromaticum]PLS32587.1 hypothetical protein CYV31_14630 [Carnobacterium maltaromaticum]PLS32767.1 hypothetical protein CYV30_14640 [Carnobacterium maltaromaticum]PLS33352.1 hypothetical protein CYV33_12440 [Carnobacterium maltaromaticum]PLS40754.1 hypothetical protein CYV28_14590 [Carnobacterium maltaromaticum]PLS41150.1 hypothetical protein CYV27_14660 [Carnobacterium maltaromaticum]
MKRLVSSLTILIVVILVSIGFSTQKTIKDRNKKEYTLEKNNLNNSDENMKITIASENKKEVAKTSSAMAVDFDSLETIKNRSTLGIEGIVIKEESYVHSQEESPSRPYTKLTLEITKVLSGDANLVGQTIIILESGGEITKEELGFKEKFPEMSEEELQEEIIVLSDGIENTRIGEEIVGFLTDDMGDMQTDFSFYSFVGEYNSRFKKNPETNRFERVLPEEGYEESPKLRRSVSNDEESRNNEIEDELNQLVESTN